MTPDSDSSCSPSARTSHLLEQLMQIARMSALEEMASGIAHELNQPMGAIATFAQTGERMLGLPAPMVNEARDLLHHIGNEALKAGRGIHRIRGLFRGDDSTRIGADMAEVVSELLPVLHLLAERSKVGLDIDIQPTLPRVSIDRLRIQHVLFALVQNALDVTAATDGAVVRIEIGGDRYSVLICIIDHGAGIPADSRGQLFRPFFTTKANGTGLGLASSRAIVEAHEGTIGYDDVEGGGTKFWVRLPATSGANET